MLKLLFSVTLLAAAMVLAAETALAQSASPLYPAHPLEPDELLLVYNSDDPQSRELAGYYAKARSVPEDRLLGVRAAARREEISREHFDRFIRGPVRSALDQSEFGPKIRCLVLFQGLPIRVGPKQVSAAEQHAAKTWNEQLPRAMGELERIIGVLQTIAGSPASAPEASLKPEQLPQAVQLYRETLEAAGKRVEALREEGKGSEEYKQVVTAMQIVEGAVSVIARTSQAELAPEAGEQLQKALEKTNETEAQIRELRERGLADPARDEARKLILQNHGLIGYIQSLQYDLALVRAEESGASLDSELAIARYDDHVLYRWVSNTLSWKVRANPAMLAGLTPQQRSTPALMTARIDGPSPAVAKRLIDDAIAAETTGLAGRVCLDARGLPESKTGLVEYDRDLRKLANLLSRQTKLEVKLDSNENVFQPGACPQTMLYCGWYSLRNYVDAFEFVPGAVGYHLASFEAISIREPDERGWVKGLLEDGVAATVGSVAEPYLQAFPRPSEFFGLLLTGRFSLAECYAYTSDMNSWMMLLIGDPLYRPFAKNPKLGVDQVYPAELIPSEFK